MDPVSLSVSCYTLITAIANLSTQVSGFIRSVRNARSDVDALTRELASLRTVLEVLVGDSTDGNSIPEPVEKQLVGVIANCNQVISQIETSLAKYTGDGIRSGMKWTVTGRDDMEKLRSHLGAHKSTLELALELVNLSINRDIKTDTQELRTDTSELKEDTAILKQSSAIPQANGDLGPSGYVLQNYLDSLTIYTTEVYEASVADLEETLSDDTIQEEQSSPKDSSTNHIFSNSVTEKATESPKEQSKGEPGKKDESSRAEHGYRASIENDGLATPDSKAGASKEPQPKDLGSQLPKKDSASILKPSQTSDPQQETSSSDYLEQNADAKASNMIARFNQTISEYTKAVEADPGNHIYLSNRRTALVLTDNLRKALGETQLPIKFKDAVGRKFSFPWHLARTWEGMEELIREAFVHVDIIGPHIAEGHYDLIDSNGKIILPSAWEKNIKPDSTISMHLWPMPEPKAEEIPGTQAPKTPAIPASKEKKKPSTPIPGSTIGIFFGGSRPKRPKRKVGKPV